MTAETKQSEHSSTLPGFLGVIDSTISRIESFMLAAGVLLMAINTIANVVGRFVIGESIFFSEELNRILIILITTIGGVLRSFAKSKGETAGKVEHQGADPKLEAENKELRKEIGDLRERLHVLERITVDKENSLAREIEDLRSK